MSPLKTFLRLLKYFKIYKWRIVAGLIAVAIMSLSEISYAFLGSRLIDILQSISQQVRSGQEILVPVVMKVFDYIFYSTTIHGNDESFQFIYRFAIVAFIVVLIKVTFVYIREYVMSSVQQKILVRFRVDLFDRIIALPIRYFDENKTGYIMSRITNDVFNLEQSLIQLIEIAQNLVYTLFFATAVFITNWKLAIVTIIIFSLSGEISRKYGDRIRKHSHDITNTLADISAFLQERIAAVRIVKSFTREEEEKRVFRNKVGSNYHFSMKIVRAIALLSSTNELFNTTAVLLLVIFCGYLFITGAMAIDMMILFIFLIINLRQPVKALGEGAARIQKTLVSAGYIFEILDLPNETNRKSAPSIIIKEGTVEFRNVSFAYAGDIQALKEVNLNVASGEKVALVGPSGGGKSTFVNLISRFYELSEGAIFVDGMNIQDIDLFGLRSQIAVVPQDVILFSGTIFENVRYGRLEAQHDEVIEAAKAANAHVFIEKLEKGYDTEVGERGLQLSGGQRQRIAIARAILRNPRILLLDEATSALDTESELMVQEALDRLMEGRTSFIIAHRLSTIAHCDRIVVIDSGRIVEVGTHDELLRIESGLYRRLHSLQFADNSAS
jgi:ATP-binding cassette, subfamily B, bacterial MsbA